jgi:hypothetical protein
LYGTVGIFFVRLDTNLVICVILLLLYYYDFYLGISGRNIKGGYSVPSEQAGNVVNALKNCGKRGYRVVENGGQAATFIFDL